MLVYDVTNEKSFENIRTWIKNIEQNAADDVEKMILGNKCDMNDKRVITKDQGQKVCCIYPNLNFIGEIAFSLSSSHLPATVLCDLSTYSMICL